MRNDEWLEKKLDNIWATYFSNVLRGNVVKICFGRNARTRLGSIRRMPGEGNKTSEFGSLITITGYFRDENVPEYVVEAVIAHELCHYAHGFFSPLPQQYKHPHQGRTVDREMIRRGMGDILLAEQKWLKTEWKNIVHKSQDTSYKIQTKNKPQIRRSKPKNKNLWDLFFGY